MIKEDKKIFVENLTKELKTAKSIVLVNYSGMGVKAQQDLKAKLKAVDAKMVVVKNTLLKRAGEEAKIDAGVMKDEVLVGQNALVIANGDPIAPLSVLGQFAKEFEIPHFRVGVVEGTFQDEASLIRLSNLPGKDALLSQVLGSLMSPLYALTGTLGGNLGKLVYILDQKAKS
jgi:large subunit ribosomal protein L10